MGLYNKCSPSSPSSPLNKGGKTKMNKKQISAKNEEQITKKIGEIFKLVPNLNFYEAFLNDDGEIEVKFYFEKGDCK